MGGLLSTASVPRQELARRANCREAEIGHRRHRRDPVESARSEPVGRQNVHLFRRPLRARTDSGDAADTFATGGKLEYLTLGGILPVPERFASYANVQVPVYQNVNGIQLTPKYTVPLGAKYAF
jgi:hypothetical protein